MKPGKIAIIGAGHVGTHCALSILFKGEAEELIFIDCKEEKAEAEALDMSDMLSLLPRQCIVRKGDYSDCTDAEIVINATGSPRAPGQTRLDQFDASLTVVNDIAPKLKASGFSGICISISNPADIIADILRRKAGIPDNRIFSTGTGLDSCRLKRVLAEISGVARDSIHAYAMGEHGYSQMIPFSHITIGGKPFYQLREEEPEVWGKYSLEEIRDRTRNGGDTIINKKGSTEYGIGIVCAEFVSAIRHDQKRVFPCGAMLHGEYGHQGFHVGVPAVIGKNGVEKVIEIALTPEEKELFDASCAVIEGFIAKA